MDRSHARCALVAFVLLGYSLTAGAQAQKTNSKQEQSSTSQDTALSSQLGQEKPAADITAVPNRPTFASTAEMVQLGAFEIEYGVEAAQGHQNINGLLKWGAIKNLELWFLNNPIERDAGIAGLAIRAPDPNSNCFRRRRRGQRCHCSM